MSDGSTDPAQLADAHAAAAEAYTKAAAYQGQGRGTFVAAAHPSQLPDRPGAQDPGVMGQPKGHGQ